MVLGLGSGLVLGSGSAAPSPWVQLRAPQNPLLQPPLPTRRRLSTRSPILHPKTALGSHPAPRALPPLLLCHPPPPPPMGFAAGASAAPRHGSAPRLGGSWMGFGAPQVPPGPRELQPAGGARRSPEEKELPMRVWSRAPPPHQLRVPDLMPPISTNPAGCCGCSHTVTLCCPARPRRGGCVC